MRVTHPPGHAPPPHPRVILVTAAAHAPAHGRCRRFKTCPHSLRLPLLLVAPAPGLGRGLWGWGRRWPPLIRLGVARSSATPPGRPPSSLRALMFVAPLPARCRAFGKAPCPTSAFPTLSLPAARRPSPLSPPSRSALLPPLRSLRSLPGGYSFRPTKKKKKTPTFGKASLRAGGGGRLLAPLLPAPSPAHPCANVASPRRPPFASLKRVGGKKKAHGVGAACRGARHFNHYFNSDTLTIRQLENKFGGYQKSLYFCRTKKDKRPPPTQLPPTPHTDPVNSLYYY